MLSDCSEVCGLCDIVQCKYVNCDNNVVCYSDCSVVLTSDDNYKVDTRAPCE